MLCTKPDLAFKKPPPASRRNHTTRKKTPKMSADEFPSMLAPPRIRLDNLGATATPEASPIQQQNQQPNLQRPPAPTSARRGNSSRPPSVARSSGGAMTPRDGH